MATECSWNDGSKTQYYVVILDRLPGHSGGLDRLLGHSGGLERAPEWRVRGPLTVLSEVEGVEHNTDWKASFARRAWSILLAALYHASGSVSAGCP